MCLIGKGGQARQSEDVEDDEEAEEESRGVLQRKVGVRRERGGTGLHRPDLYISSSQHPK